MTIDPIHRAVADRYISNGGNKSLAYRDIKPDVSRGSSQVLACRLFKLPEVIEYLENKQALITTEALASRDFLIEEAHEIGLEAREAGKLNTALTAVEAKAKLNKVYDSDTGGADSYSKVIQALTINGDVNIYQDKDKTIDVSPS